MKNVLDQIKPGHPQRDGHKGGDFWLYRLLIVCGACRCEALLLPNCCGGDWPGLVAMGGGSCAPSHDDVYLSRRRNWLIFHNLPSLTHFNPFSSGHTNNDGGPLLSYSSLCVVGYRVLSIHSISLYKNANNTSSTSVLVDKWRSKNG